MGFGDLERLVAFLLRLQDELGSEVPTHQECEKG
jgi:hypothetical protein